MTIVEDPAGTASNETGRAARRHRLLQPRRAGLVARFRELWEHRALIAFFGRRLLEKRYTRTWLGIVWIPLRPGLDVALRVLLFGGLLGVSSGEVPYFVFFAVGMAAWMVLESAAYWATRSLEINRSILRRIYVPRAAVLVAAVIPAGVDFVLYFLIAALGATVLWLANGSFDINLVPGEHLLVALGGLCLLLLFGLSIGLWTSVLAATARDVRFGFNYVMRLWFFITPVIYPVSAIPADFRPIAEYNPATAPVETAKHGLLGTAAPQANSLIVTLVTVTCLLLWGMWWFGRSERAGINHV